MTKKAAIYTVGRQLNDGDMYIFSVFDLEPAGLLVLTFYHFIIWGWAQIYFLNIDSGLLRNYFKRNHHSSIRIWDWKCSFNSFTDTPCQSCCKLWLGFQRGDPIFRIKYSRNQCTKSHHPRRRGTPIHCRNKSWGWDITWTSDNSGTLFFILFLLYSFLFIPLPPDFFSQLLSPPNSWLSCV